MSAMPPIHLAGETAWRDATRRLAAGEAGLVSLWGDEGCMRMALRESNGVAAIVTVACEGGAFLRWRGFTRRRAGSSGRPAIFSASRRSAPSTIGAGWITADGRSVIRSDARNRTTAIRTPIAS